MEYRNILVCLDLRSREAPRLLQRAATLLAGGGRVTAVTVIETGTFDDARDAEGSLLEDEYWSRSAHLARLCAEAGQPDAQGRVLVGDAATEIAAWAREQRCDLVVLGDHGPRPARPLQTSTIDDALRLLGCDALVVKTAAVARPS
jgi:nucleotide-binding universal stress UspA family protein